MPHYYIDDDLIKSRSVDGHFNWLIINHLCELIDNDED